MPCSNAGQSSPEVPHVKLFRRTSVTRNWECLHNSARPCFCKTNGSMPITLQWHLEVEPPGICACIDKSFKYILKEEEDSICFCIQGTCYAMKFRSAQPFAAFRAALEAKQYENLFEGPSTSEDQTMCLRKTNRGRGNDRSDQDRREDQSNHGQENVPVGRINDVKDRLEQDDQKDCKMDRGRQNGREHCGIGHKTNHNECYWGTHERGSSINDGESERHAGVATLGYSPDVPKASLLVARQDHRSATSLQVDEVHCQAENSIHGVVVGAFDNSYILRGTQMDVMRNMRGRLKDTGLTVNISNGGQASDRTAFAPSRIILSNAEHRMNMLDCARPHHMFQADVECHAVVREWNFTKENVVIPIKDIATESKSAQLTSSSTFLGLDSNRLCRWDARTSAGIVAGDKLVVTWQGGKDYACGTNLSCVATSGDGYIAVGSEDGKVRLFSNSNLTRAVSLLPDIGGAVTAIDVTFNGEWVLVTTNSRLVLVQVIFTGPGGLEMSGYKKSISKSCPRRVLLELRPEDRLQIDSKPLQKAKFSWVTEQGKKERLIVAVCGPFTVVWNVAKATKAANSEDGDSVKPAVCREYMVVKREDDIVAAACMHSQYRVNQLDMLVMATRHNVYSVV